MKKTCFLLFSLLITNNYAFAKEPIILDNSYDIIMDTSKWLTHPIGRYIIKLPPTAQITWSPLSFSRRYYLEWQEGKNIKDARKLIKAGTKRNHTFLDTKNILSQNMSSQAYNFYEDTRLATLWHEGEGYEFSPMQGEDEVTEKTEVYISNFIQYLKENIQYHSQGVPLSNTAGIYFNGGFLPDPIDKEIIYPYEEAIVIEITFPDRFALQLRISFNHDEGYYPVSIGEETFIAHIRAKEILRQSEEDKYNFLASTRNVGYEDDYKQYSNDYITIMLESPYIDTKKYLAMTQKERDIFWNNIKSLPAFKDSDEALAFFNAIKANIRLRPDGVNAPLPSEAQGKPYFIIYDRIIPYM